MENGGAILKIISIIIIIMILLKFCLIFLWPFIAAGLFAIILEPIVVLMNRIGIKRRTGSVLSFTLISFIIVSFLFYLTGYVYNNLIMLFEKLPDVIKTFTDNFRFLGNSKMDYNQIVNGAQNIIISYKDKIFNTLVTTMGSFVYCVIIMITTIFISLDLEKIDFSIRRILSHDAYYIMSNVIKKITKVLNVEIKLVSISTIQTIIGLYILGVNDPLTIGLICGILDILPVVGPGMIFIPWAIYEILMKNVFLTVGLIFLYILLEIIREIMQVKFMGDNLRIHPLVTIFSLYIGFIIYGVWGVLIGPIIYLLLQELIQFYERRRLFQI